MKELRQLIKEYNGLIHDHKYPIDLSTKEQHHLEGYDAALIRVIRDLETVMKNIKLNNNEITQKDKLAYTE
jgi:hypothetical protein